jgi:glutamine synthetase
MDLLFNNKVSISKTILEYIWLDGYGNFRHKTRIMFKNIELVPSPCDIDEWNYDGSSTGETSSKTNTEIILKPVFVCRNPFKTSLTKINSYYVLCETYSTDKKPMKTNTRYKACKIFEMDMELIEKEQPWYGIEQEYFICDPNNMNLPLGFKNYKLLENKYDYIDLSKLIPDGSADSFYCKMGNKFGKKIANKHLEACIMADLDISGINAEVSPGQWEYQIGPCLGINAADQLVMSRFILEQIADEYGYFIDYSPKLIPDINGRKFNGSGCHVNFSTFNMRNGCSEGNGVYYIHKAINKLQLNHEKHIQVYGKDNHLRLTGECETSSCNFFTFGIGTRDTSVRIGNSVINDGYGYFEDRRPSANMDPYLVTSILYDTICVQKDDNYY